MLTADMLFAFILFAFVSSITPGPNNTMLLTSGVNFGFNRTIPHMLGISCGFTLMVLAVGLGLGAVFKAYPLLYTVLRYAGAGAAAGAFGVTLLLTLWSSGSLSAVH